MADDDKPVSVLDSVRAAMAEHSGGDDEGEAAPSANQEVPPSAERSVAVDDGASGAAERARDEAGRFKAKEAETDSSKGEKRPTLSLKPKTAPEQGVGSPQGAQKANGTAQEPAATKTEAIAPPLSWKGSAKLDWNRLPASTQTEFLERINEVEAARTELAPLKEMIDLNRDMLVREAGSVAEGVRQLLQFHQLSLDKPLDLIQHIARSRGIDLRAAFAGQPAQQQGNPPQPDINSLIAQTVQQQFQTFEQKAQEQQRQTQLNQNLQTVQAFAADPAHPYFNDVAPEMEALLKGGIAKDLGDAYDKAIKLNPTVSGAVEAQRQKEAEDKRKADADVARKAAAASVRGSPVPDGQRGAGNQKQSVLEATRASFAEHA